MHISETPLTGAYSIETQPNRDDRGLFARTWCREELREHGLDTKVVQCNTSFNIRKGTIRGMHWQAPPFEEIKIVRCTRGAILDVIVDLRKESPTFCKWFAVELTADNRKMIYIPGGFAHGFQTIEENSEVFYQISEPYRPEFARGARWDDPSFGIRWPLPDPFLSLRDRRFPDFSSLSEGLAAVADK